jgi:hypothetical protein
LATSFRRLQLLKSVASLRKAKSRIVRALLRRKVHSTLHRGRFTHFNLLQTSQYSIVYLASDEEATSEDVRRTPVRRNVEQGADEV